MTGSNTKQITSSQGDSYILKDDIILKEKICSKENSIILQTGKHESISTGTRTGSGLGTGLGTGLGSGTWTGTELGTGSGLGTGLGTGLGSGTWIGTGSWSGFGLGSSLFTPFQQQCSLQDETSSNESYRDRDRDRDRGRDGENDRCSQTSSRGAKSTVSAVSDDDDDEDDIDVNDTSLLPQHQLPTVLSPRSILSSEAMKLLRSYYVAFNDHDVSKTVGFLALDVKVIFPDVNKNWASASTAYDRYTTMFRKSPRLNGKFSLLDLVHEKGGVAITVYCHFTCSASNVNTVREMVYLINNDLIQAINNKY